MFGSHKDDDLANSEDPKDSIGFVSDTHPDPTSAPEPPAPGAIDTSLPAQAAPVTDTPTPAGDDTATTDAPQFGQPFTPGTSLPAADDTKPSDDSTPATDEKPAADAPVNNDLIDLKKEALQQLTPLVDHL